MTKHVPQNTYWPVRWEGGYLTDPSGIPQIPIWKQGSDVSFVHNLLDEWAKRYQFIENLPRTNQWSSWWIPRYDLHRKLVNILPQLRLLSKIKKDLVINPKHIVLKNPPEIWWYQLFRTIYKDSEISIEKFSSQESHSSNIKCQNVSMLRESASISRLKYLSSTNLSKPRVLVISRDRVWTGEEDSELNTAIKAMTDGGLEVIVLATGQKLDDRIRSLRTRPVDHLFDDIFLCNEFYVDGLVHVPTFKFPQEGLVVDGLDLTTIVYELFSFLYTNSYIKQVTYSQVIPRFIKAVNAQAAVITDENMSGCDIKIGLMCSDIPTIAVQHAVVHENHLNYVYPLDTEQDSILLCDATCVYGKHTEKILTENSIYPKPSIAITGQVQMDGRQHIAKQPWMHRTQLGIKLRNRVLPANCDKMLLFTSQGAYRNLTGPKLFRAFVDSHPRNFLVIRPHPNDGTLQFWDNLVHHNRIKRRTLIELKGSIDEWLDACDFHLSATSTVLGEAVIFGRPNITIGSGYLGDWLGCLAANVAVELDNYPSLDSALAEWFEHSPEKLCEFEHNRQQYIKNHFYQVDGQVGDRIASVVEQELKKMPTDKTVR